jgi:hypothetical protein
MDTLVQRILVFNASSHAGAQHPSPSSYHISFCLLPGRRLLTQQLLDAYKSSPSHPILIHHSHNKQTASQIHFIASSNPHKFLSLQPHNHPQTKKESGTMKSILATLLLTSLIALGAAIPINEADAAAIDSLAQRDANPHHQPAIGVVQERDTAAKAAEMISPKGHGQGWP